jgi:hypothetical protein
LRDLVTITASATDNFYLKKVDFYLVHVGGDILLGTDTSSPYSIVWDSAEYGSGDRTIYLQAYDCVGNMTESQSIVVGTDNADPTVIIDSPLTGGNIERGTQVDIYARATDFNPEHDYYGEGIDYVDFYYSGTSSGYIGRDEAPPEQPYVPFGPPAHYIGHWDTTGLPLGPYTITATAYDNCGRSSSTSIEKTLVAE